MTQQSNQEELIEYVTNPDNLKKAAEGSMQKRQALLDNQKLREKIDETFDNFELDILAYRQFGDSINIIKKSKDEKIQKLLDLIEQEKRQAKLGIVMNCLTILDTEPVHVLKDALLFDKARLEQLQSKKGDR